MNFSLTVLVSLIIFVVTCQAAAPKIRYINSIPQFGSSDLTAATPSTALFSSVNPNTVTSYTDTTAGNWNFFSTFGKKVHAGSDQFTTSADTWYTVYTYQRQQRTLKNLLIVDQSNHPSGNHAAIRTVNLAQFNYSINVTATSSNNAQILSWSNVGYSQATSYSLIAPGTYNFDWSSSNFNKRNMEQNNCTMNCGGAVIKKNKSYTYYVLPTTSFVVPDGSTSAKRGIRSKRIIQKKTGILERLSQKNDKVAEPAVETETENENETETEEGNEKESM